MSIIKKIFFLIIVPVLLHLVGYRNVETVKKYGPKKLMQAGYNVITYDGYMWNPIEGGNVYYVVSDSLGYKYSLSLTLWRGEIHLYNQNCLNCIKIK